MKKCENISLYLRRPLAINDFATAPFWISWNIRKIWFSLLSVQCIHVCSLVVGVENKRPHLQGAGGRLSSISKRHWETVKIVLTFSYHNTFKGQCHEIFCFRFFHKSSSPKPLKKTLGSFQIFSKIRGDIHCKKNWSENKSLFRIPIPPTVFSISVVQNLCSSPLIFF